MFERMFHVADPERGAQRHPRLLPPPTPTITRVEGPGPSCGSARVAEALACRRPRPLFVIPTKVGTHVRVDKSDVAWVPSFAGMTVLPGTSSRVMVSRVLAKTCPRSGGMGYAPGGSARSTSNVPAGANLI